MFVCVSSCGSQTNSKPISMGTVHQYPNPTGGYFDSKRLQATNDFWQSWVCRQKLNCPVCTDSIMREDGIACQSEISVVFGALALEFAEV